MRRSRLFLVLLLAVLSATSARGAGVGSVALSWDACNGPINRALAPGTKVALVASVYGQSLGHKAFQVRIFLRPVGSVLPDAWRFDQGGCQGLQRISFEYLQAADACPAFQGDLPSVQVPDYAFDPVYNRWRIVFADAYPSGIAAPDPNVRYEMARIVFDHTHSVVGSASPDGSCGGLETPMCFYLRTAEWVSMTGDEVPFLVNQDFLTVNDPTFVSCGSSEVPARPATWGAVKAQYRQ
jgi:hypothetical protein